MWVSRIAAGAAAVSSAILLSSIAEEYPLISVSRRARVGLPIALTLALLYEMHATRWSSVGRIGFVAALLGTFCLVYPFASLFFAAWWLMAAGLALAGADGLIMQLPRSAVFLALLSATLLVRVVLVLLWGEYVGEFASLTAYGAGWLLLACLLILEGDSIRKED